MKKVLEAFFEGTLLEGAHSVRRDSAYHQALAEVIKAEDELLPLLSKEQTLQYEKTLNLRADMADLAETGYFCYGYRLGMLMAAEVFLSRDELVRGAPVL